MAHQAARHPILEQLRQVNLQLVDTNRKLDQVVELLKMQAETLAELDLRAVGTRPAVLRRVHGLSHRQPKVVFLDGLRGEDWVLVRRHLPEGWRMEG